MMVADSQDNNQSMTSQERVLTACAFKPPDRIPRFDSFWEFPDSWRARLGSPENLTDIVILTPDEGTFTTRARYLKDENGWIYEIDKWGRMIRHRRGAYFVEPLEVPIPEGVDIDSVKFDPPEIDVRFLQEGNNSVDLSKMLQKVQKRHCVFGKIGGPYLRSTFVRGEVQFLRDIASEPILAKAIADKVGEYLMAIAVEEIKRWSLQDTGIWIYDDMAYNDGPMFSPVSFEKIFLPIYRRMIKVYKEAGVKYIFLHSDGNIRPFLEMLVDAGIDGIHPLERRANMDIVKIRKEFPKLILAGGIDNTGTLINGSLEKIKTEVREIIDIGRQGGIIIGTHSVSPEVPLEHFVVYDETYRIYGSSNTQFVKSENR